MRIRQRKGERIMRRRKRKRKECPKKAISGIVSESVEVELHPNVMNSEEGLSLSKPQKLLICTLKERRNPPLKRSHDMVLTRGSSQLPFEGPSFPFLSHFFLLPTHDPTGLRRTHS
jgi:hypothetical protein